MQVYNPAAGGASAAIGIFDSGVGGLSVLQALRQVLPNEALLYLADSAYAPYGERDAVFIEQRSLRIAAFLQQRRPLKALVVACNTATTTAIAQLRAQWPQLPIVGVEPAIKPAALASKTGHIGVLATRGTVGSPRFAQLVAGFAQGVQVHAVACDGLAAAIENSVQPQLDRQAADQAVYQLCARYLTQAGSFGVAPGQLDCLVLGCTHYVFAAQAWAQLLDSKVQVLDTGAAVARRTRQVLTLATQRPLQQSVSPGGALASQAAIELLTTGSLPALQAAAWRWLQLPASCCQVVEVGNTGG